MSQATPQCAHSIHVCRGRFTRLNADGTIASGSKNSYVTDAITHANFSPEIVQGSVQNVISGCNTISATYTQPDLYERWNVDLQICRFEPALIEMLTGAALILDASTIPVPIGLQMPGPQTVQPLCAAEFWTDARLYNSVATLPYIRWVVTAATWSFGGFNLENDFAQPSYSGKTHGNANWASGPYGVGDTTKQAVGVDFGWFWDSVAPPAAACAYAAVPAS